VQAEPHNWPGIARHLAGHGFELDQGFDPRRFEGGLANLNYLVRLSGTPADANGPEWAVLRRPPPGDLPPGAHDMEREHRILHSLWRALPLAPRSYHLCTDLAVAGVPFQLLEYRPGVAVRGDSLAPFPETPASGRAISRMLVDGLVAIHGVDCAAVGLDTLGKPDHFMARAAKGWIRRGALACENVPKSMAGLAEWLERHTVGLTGEITLLHNDFKLDNLLLDAATMKPVAVLDWDMGTRGDALFDLATLLSYWSEPDDPPCMHRLAQMPTARPGFMSREEAARAYSAGTNRSLRDFKVYRVLAMFKLGVVFHQLHRLHRSGAMRDQRYAGFGMLADELLDFAADMAHDRYF